MKNGKKRNAGVHDRGHGIEQDVRGEDQPRDKERAQQTSSLKETRGERAQREAATTPQSPGEPAGGE